MEFKKELYPHQLDIFKRAQKGGPLALLWEMGTGKTGGVINILRYWYNSCGKIQKTLILSPIVTLYNWYDEFKIWSNINSNRIKVIDVSGKKRVKLLESYTKEECIIIMNWEALQNDTVFDLLNKWKPEILIGDELHTIKSYKSKRAKKAVKLSDKVRENDGVVYGLTGTAILNSIQDVYMQYRFLDGGKLFGRNFFVFRNYYMIDENAGWKAKRNYFPKWVPRPEKFSEMTNKIYQISSRVTKGDCLKHLPPLVKIRHTVTLSREQEKYYKEMKNDFITFIENKKKEIKDAVVAQLAVTKALRLQQIVSGHLKTESGKILTIEKNPRLDALSDLVQELVDNHKIIIWCCFVHDYEAIGKLLDKLKIKHVFITGQMTMPQKKEAMEDFRKKKDVRIVVANRKAGGIGINLVEASYSIVYSRNFSLGDELQSEARNHRGGSEIHDKVTKVDLVARETIDEQVLNALQEKQDISNKIIDIVKGVQHE
jgi:SNF2 family DNA or RNA helicase